MLVGPLKGYGNKVGKYRYSMKSMRMTRQLFFTMLNLGRESKEIKRISSFVNSSSSISLRLLSRQKLAKNSWIVLILYQIGSLARNGPETNIKQKWNKYQIGALEEDISHNLPIKVLKISRTWLTPKGESPCLKFDSWLFFHYVLRENRQKVNYLLLIKVFVVPSLLLFFFKCFLVKIVFPLISRTFCLFLYVFPWFLQISVTNPVLGC